MPPQSPADTTPNKADDVRKLLDSGACVVLYRNELKTYTAVCVRPIDLAYADIAGVIEEMQDDGPHITDDFTPSKALYRLTEKATTGRIVNGREQSE
jgi:uncharacterized protein YeeX (DUF496 family)